MKKQLLLAACLNPALFTVKAQKPDTAQLMVHYAFSHIRDTTHPACHYTENMVLFVGKSAGVYKSYDRLLGDAAFQKQLAAATANSPDGNVNINHNSAGSGTEYYQYPNEKKLFTLEPTGPVNSDLMEDPLPVIDWKISGDTASLGGLLCQKAAAHFKGRDYTAWFCPNLPVHTGPWKLTGLPGVILEAYDAKKQVVFKFNGIEKVTPAIGLNVIAPPANAIKTTTADYNRLTELSYKDPAAYSKALTMQAAGPDGNGPKIDAIRMPGPVVNNPIELAGRK